MVSKPKRKPNIETEWLRGYVSLDPAGETLFAFSPDDLRREDIWLPDIVHGLRIGRVVQSEKLDGPGAHWLVKTEDCDGLAFEMMLFVETNAYRVELLHVKRGSRKDGGCNAA